MLSVYVVRIGNPDRKIVAEKCPTLREANIAFGNYISEHYGNFNDMIKLLDEYGFIVSEGDGIAINLRKSVEM